MTTLRNRKKVRSNNGAKDEFFLYVAFHSVFTAIANFFRED